MVATIDLDAPDQYLIDAGYAKRPRWLLKNRIIVRFADGEKFYEDLQEPPQPIPNTYSLFAETVRKRRAAEAAKPAGPDKRSLKRARTV